jgi:hypothetical protein
MKLRSINIPDSPNSLHCLVSNSLPPENHNHHAFFSDSTAYLPLPFQPLLHQDIAQLPQPSACEPSKPSLGEFDVEDMERQESKDSEDENDYMEEDEEDEEEEEDEDEVEMWVAIEKKKFVANKWKWVEAKKRNHQTEVFVR